MTFSHHFRFIWQDPDGKRSWRDWDFDCELWAWCFLSLESVWRRVSVNVYIMCGLYCIRVCVYICIYVCMGFVLCKGGVTELLSLRIERESVVGWESKRENVFYWEDEMFPQRSNLFFFLHWERREKRRDVSVTKWHLSNGQEKLKLFFFEQRN